MKKFLIVAGICGVLSGCMTPEELAAMRAQQEAQRQEQIRLAEAAQKNQIHEHCIAQGFKAKTKRYKSCISETERSLAEHTVYQAQQQAARDSLESQLRDLCIAEGLRQKKLGVFGWTDACVRNELMKRENPQQYQLELMERQTRAMEQNNNGSSINCYRFGDIMQCNRISNPSVGFHNLR